MIQDTIDEIRELTQHLDVLLTNPGLSADVVQRLEKVSASAKEATSNLAEAHERASLDRSFLWVRRVTNASASMMSATNALAAAHNMIMDTQPNDKAAVKDLENKARELHSRVLSTPRPVFTTSSSSAGSSGDTLNDLTDVSAPTPLPAVEAVAKTAQASTQAPESDPVEVDPAPASSFMAAVDFRTLSKSIPVATEAVKPLIAETAPPAEEFVEATKVEAEPEIVHDLTAASETAVVESAPELPLDEPKAEPIETAILSAASLELPQEPMQAVATEEVPEIFTPEPDAPTGVAANFSAVDMPVIEDVAAPEVRAPIVQVETAPPAPVESPKAPDIPKPTIIHNFDEDELAKVFDAPIIRSDEDTSKDRRSKSDKSAVDTKRRLIGSRASAAASAAKAPLLPGETPSTVAVVPPARESFMRNLAAKSQERKAAKEQVKIAKASAKPGLRVVSGPAPKRTSKKQIVASTFMFLLAVGFLGAIVWSPAMKVYHKWQGDQIGLRMSMLTDAIKAKNKSFDDLDKQLNAATAHSREITAKLSQANAEAAPLNNLTSEVTDLQTQLATIAASDSLINQQVQNPPTDQQNAYFKGIVAKLAAGRQQEASLNAQIATLQKQIDAKKALGADLQAKIAGYQKDLDDIQLNVNGIQSQRQIQMEGIASSLSHMADLRKQRQAAYHPEMTN